MKVKLIRMKKQKYITEKSIWLQKDHYVKLIDKTKWHGRKLNQLIGKNLQVMTRNAEQRTN